MAAQLGVSQSALSQTVPALERRLDLKLPNRTTRSVSPTEACERLYRTVGQRFADIEAELAVLAECGDLPLVPPLLRRPKRLAGLGAGGGRFAA